MSSAILIYNEAAGSHLDAEGGKDEAVRALSGCGIAADTLDGPLEVQIAASLERDADIVVVDGGDGTIRAAIKAHRGRGRPIGILPGGTMNLLATDYGVPEDRAAAAALIAAGHTRPVDYGTLGGELFLHSAVTGLPVRLGTHREKRRGRLGILDKLRLGAHALATLPRDPTLTLTTDEEGQALTLDAPSFALVVGHLEHRLLPRPHRDRVTGGRLTLFAVHPQSTSDVARLLLFGAIGELADDPSVDVRTIAGGSLASPRRRLRAMLDGESVLLASPAEISVRTGEVEVFAPSPDAQ